MKELNKVVVTAVLLLLARAQGHEQSRLDAAETVKQQPSDLHFVLSTKDGRSQFHLGEIIEMEEAYSSDAPGKYLLLSLPAKLHGGHSAQVTLQPGQHVIDRARDAGYRSAFSILHVNCRSGVGGGVGSACGDCNGAWPLKVYPIRFPYVLTTQFQILEPGHYSVQAEAANLALAPLDLEKSAPISLTSNTVEIDVVDDPAWSRGKLRDAVTRFEDAHLKYVGKGWDLISEDKMRAGELGARIALEWEMQKSAETMRALDTEDSLKEMVRHYDGAQHNPDYFYHILYQGIVQSKHRSLAVTLLADRILDPDFSASSDLMDQLTAMKLQDQFPDSFRREDDESKRRLYPAARRILHDYVLALGKSLPEKSPGALESSLRAFKAYAKEDFCTGEPLIPETTFRQLLRQVQVFDSEPEE